MTEHVQSERQLHLYSLHCAFSLQVLKYRIQLSRKTEKASLCMQEKPPQSTAATHLWVFINNVAQEMDLAQSKAQFGLKLSWLSLDWK